MTQSPSPTSLPLSARLDLFEEQLRQVKNAVSTLETLESRFGENRAQFLIDPAALLDFQKNVDLCRFKFTQIGDLSQNLSLLEITGVAKTRLEQLTAQLASIPTPKTTMLQIAEKFNSHRVHEALSDFRQFEDQFPKLTGRVYGNLWRIKGSPENLHPDFGHRAFYHRDGFHSQNNEKAEAIRLIWSSVEERLDQCIALLNHGSDAKGLQLFREIVAVYPQIANPVFGTLWKVYGGPTFQSHPQIAHNEFGALAFWGTHPNLQSDPTKKAQAIQQALPQITSQLVTCIDQNKLRRDARCLEVIREHLTLLQQGFYTSPSGSRVDIRNPLSHSIVHTEICRDGGPVTPKAPRFKETLWEVQPKNCVTIAHDLASQGNNKVNVMNFANSHVSGGAYLHHAGSQEEELFRCTGLPFALDQTHRAQKSGFYPIHKVAGPLGGVYTPATPLIRMGLDKDYQLIETPVFISVGTFAAFNRPELDVTNSDDPLLQGECLRITREKIRTCLKSAYDHGDDTLILGAFGCGAFANPPAHMSRLMMDVIQTEYQGCFKKIVFAVMKDSAEGHRHNPRGNFIPFAETVRRYGGTIYGVNGETV